MCISASAFAVDSLRVSMDDVLQKALLNSKYIERARLELKEQEILVQQKRSDLLPKISLRGSASYATNMPIYENGIFNKPAQHDVIHYLYDTGADFYLNLYNGHRDLMSIKSQKLVKEIANIDWLAASGKIKMDVCNLFLDLQLCYSNKDLIMNDIADQKEQLKEVKNLYKAGAVLHSDVLRIELELSKREMLLIKIKNDIQATNKELQLITGIEEIIVPSKHVFDKTLLDFGEMFAEAKKSAFILQRSEHEVNLKKIAIKQAESNYLPTVGFTGTYTFANPQIFLYPYNDSWYSLGIIGLKASIPISAIYNNKNVVRASRVSYDKEKVNHHHEEEIIENKLLKAHLDYKLAIEQKEVCLKNVDLAKENARIIKNRYFKSAALVTDLLDADMQYLQTLFELESATVAIQKHYYFIEFIKGTI
ncbi:TolC family protein [Sphingobacterium rhinopitheci]|uniref:TolC family protein n=1 Tax=Sphingobacterium rhinopitheci TaxID=2781960 RepID=UPI001F51CBE6|nr:TolC family protein [Sphingobacterium rhinopitheci]